MGKHTNEFKRFIVEERIVQKKPYTQIEREHGVLRGTVYQWVERYKAGTLHIDFRETKKTTNQNEIEYEFLKKSFALLKKIRSEQHE